MPCFDGSYTDPHSVLKSNFSNLKVIGQSCSGCVFSAVDKIGGKHEKVALKRLSLKRKSHCRVALRELRILKRLDHENIVKNLNIRTPSGCEFCESPSEELQKLDHVYLVEELLDTDLHNILDRTEKLPEKISKLFLYQILRGLKYTHSANVIHRDIKPGNLFVNLDDLSLKIGDFGLSRIVDERFEHAGNLTELVTTRYYRAPEVIKTRGNYNSAVDIWSSGCVFSEMCTGKVLFPGENDMQQIDCIESSFHAEGNTSGRFQTSKLTEISQAGLDLLQKMLRLDPSKRPTAAQLLEDPYFGDICDPADEPICPAPQRFHIEHEVDDLPIQTLRSMIAKECCPENTGFSSSLFDGFDEEFETIAHDKETNTEPRKASRNDQFYLTCLEGDQRSQYTESDSSASASDIDVCPSLSNIINSSIEDEPCRDPGCNEARRSFPEYESYSLEGDSELNLSKEHCSSEFPKATPMLDLSNCIITPTMDKRKSLDFSCPIIPFQKLPKNLLHVKGIEKDILNMSKLGLQSLEPRRTCRTSEFSVTERLKGGKFHGNFHHWDPVRIWI